MIDRPIQDEDAFTFDGPEPDGWAKGEGFASPAMPIANLSAGVTLTPELLATILGDWASTGRVSTWVDNSLPDVPQPDLIEKKED